MSAMASYGPNGQRRYFPEGASTTNLLPPQSSGQAQNTHQRSFNPPSRGPSLRSVRSTSSANDSAYFNGGREPGPSITDKFSLAADPVVWGTILSPNNPEPDDELHNPDPRRDRRNDGGSNIFTYRGLTNLGCLILLCVGLLTLFAGYPLISFFTSTKLSTNGGFNLGGINGSGQVPGMTGNWGLIDLETDKSLYTKPSNVNPNQKMQLVFSDEFNTDGRTFYPGDDPYWEAVDLHYWETNNLEWYDPSAVTTKDGSLQITLTQVKNHGLNFMGGMVTTWNKFCFTGGLVEVSVMLPGANNVAGLWPAVWTMGNLGRAGYGATLEGLWPYTYDDCDVGTAPNQTINGQPQAATINGDQGAGGALSFLPGQRLSRCTCAGESHPGPVHSDGTFVGRAAPEIDIFEATTGGPDGGPLTGQVSQSAQWAPFNNAYQLSDADDVSITDPTITTLNSYQGGAFQQATSALTDTNQGCYELEQRCFALYGYEYKPGFDTGYIAWLANSRISWTLNAPAMGPDPVVNISARSIPQEPMHILVNLGLSENFGGNVDFEHLTFPTTMFVDYIRVYQEAGNINVGCDPKDFPTQAYINQYIGAYSNPNFTTWVDDFKQPWPKNSLVDQC